MIQSYIYKSKINNILSPKVYKFSTSSLFLFPSSEENNDSSGSLSSNQRDNSPEVGTEDLYSKDVKSCTLNELKKIKAELEDITSYFPAAGIEQDEEGSDSRRITYERISEISRQIVQEEKGDIVDAVSTQGTSQNNPIFLDKVQVNTIETAITIEDSPEPSNKRAREDSADNIMDIENNNKKFKQDSSDITADTEPMDFIDFE